MTPEPQLSFQERMAQARRAAMKAVRPAKRISDKPARNEARIKKEPAVEVLSEEKKLAAERRAQQKETERKEKEARAAERQAQLMITAKAREMKKRLAAADRADKRRAEREAAAAAASWRPMSRKREERFPSRPFSMEGKKTVLVDKTHNTVIIVDINANEAEVIRNYQEREAEKKRSIKASTLYLHSGKKQSGAARDEVRVPKHVLRSTKNNFF